MKVKTSLLGTISLMFLVCSSYSQAQVSFFQPPLYSGSAQAQFIADFNRDGKPDILASDGTLNLGNGDGTFTLGTSLSGTSVPILAVADYNGDGKPDVLEYTTDMLLVLLGKGDGTFQSAISTPSNASLSLFAAADLNGDGKADLVGVSGSTLFVYISNGDGTFKPGVQYNLPAPSTGWPLFFGDFNSDGSIDVALQVTPSSPSVSLVVFLGNGDGTFQTTPKTSASVVGTFFAVGDFNSDGRLDIAISTPSPCVGTCEVYIQLGNGDGTLQSPAAAFSGSGQLATADLRGDGKLDLVLVSSASPSPLTVQIYLGNGDGTFANPVSYGVSVGGGGGPINIADFTGDGRLDIAAGGILLGNGDGTFKSIQVAVLPTSPGAAVAGDFEKKGALDIAAATNASQNSTDLYVLSNNGKGALSLIHTYALQQDTSGIATADFNGDGNLDLFVTNFSGGTQNWSYSVMLGNGDGSFQAPVTFPQSGPSPNSFVVADFNGDHKPDLAFGWGTPNSSDIVAILLGNGDGTFTPPVNYYAAGPSSLLAADFNSDGKLDIAFCSSIGTGFLYGNGDGSFQTAVFPSSLTSFCPFFTADFNNDGKADLMASAGQVALGNGDGTFTVLPPITLPSFVSLYQPAAIADFNGDGKLDLMGITYGRHPEGTAIMLGNGDGTFGSMITVTDGAMAPSGELAVDLNGDGEPDIVFPWANYTGYCPPCVGTPTGMAVLFNTTPPGFGLSASAPSPAPVTEGHSAISTVTAVPTFGFNGTVALSCAGLPSGTTCTFTPASIAGSSGTSTLTITTSAATAAGTYPLQIQGGAGSATNSTTVSLIVQAVPDFSITPASGSPTSQTISAGQTASFSLALVGAGSFSGTVNLSCAITPVVTPAPTCNLSNSSVQITSTTNPTVTVNIGTTASVTTSAGSRLVLPTGPMLSIFMLSGLTVLFARRRKWLPALVTPALAIALALCMSCGGGTSVSTSHHTTPGTPSGTYTATITASSGSLTHNMPLQVIVQ